MVSLGGVVSGIELWVLTLFTGGREGEKPEKEDEEELPSKGKNTRTCSVWGGT